MTIDYYDKKILSATTFKRFLDCPDAAYHEPIIDSESMKIGRIVDAHLLGGEPEELLTPTGKVSSKNKLIAEMVERAQNSKKFMASLEGEHQKEYEFEIDGVKWKCKLDNVNEKKGFFSDLKTTASLKEQYNVKTKQYERPWIYWNYDVQMAVYAHATGLEKAFLSFIAKDNLDLRIIPVPIEVLRNALHEKVLAKNHEVAEQFYEGKNLWRCGKCSYCIKTRPDKELIGDWYETE